MVLDFKTVRDAIHGDIKVEGLFVDLLASPELQRLYNIKQLGLAHLVFPGAHHTRLEHSLGAFHIASKAGEILNLKDEDKKILACASMLHDIGHGPFSHTLEALLRDSLNVDHVDLTEKLICGEYEIFDEKEKELVNSPSVYEILIKNNVDLKTICDTIKGKLDEKIFLSQLLNSTIDVDQMDYLIRDAYYTGVAYGLIDIDRFLQTLRVSEGRLVVERKGVNVIENILMARTLMYSSVYFHKTVRIAELMLSKAIELMPFEKPFDFFKMTDAELINNLKEKGGFQREIATCLKYRKLFKQAYSASYSDLNEEQMEVIKKLDDPTKRREKEEEIENALNVPSGHVIIDIPYRELHQSEPRIDQIDVLIQDKNRFKNLDDFTPIPDAIKMRSIPDWIIMIITDEKHRIELADKAVQFLFS